MSDGDYAEMIEIPVSTCEMVVLPKKRKKNNLRKKVIDRVNKNLQNENVAENCYEEKTKSAECFEKKTPKKFKFDIVSAQVLAIFVLVVAILVTNIFWEDSGINTLLRSVFKNENQAEMPDERDYKSFTVYLPTKANTVELSDGIMTVSGESAIYSPCQGEIVDVKQTDGKYTVTINHSDVFKTIIRNADYAYFDIGDTVYESVPVCYTSDGGAEILMYNGSLLLTNYTITDGSIVWQS